MNKDPHCPFWQGEAALFYKENEIYEGYVSVDGLVVAFPADLASVFLVGRPYARGVWWFNSTKDRMIAEYYDPCDRSYIVANPQAIWSSGFEILS